MAKTLESIEGYSVVEVNIDWSHTENGDANCCNGCAFTDDIVMCDQVKCTDNLRSDNKDVIFVRTYK